MPLEGVHTANKSSSWVLSLGRRLNQFKGHSKELKETSDIADMEHLRATFSVYHDRGHE